MVEEDTDGDPFWLQLTVKDWLPVVADDSAVVAANGVGAVVSAFAIIVADNSSAVSSKLSLLLGKTNGISWFTSETVIPFSVVRI